jgi:uncharacterized protein (TIGR03435 family)
MRVTYRVFLAALLSAAAFAQTVPARVEFEVASIRPATQPTEPQVNVGVRIDGVQVHCTYLSLKDYIRLAYRVKDYQVTGPDWIAAERFDISAKLPEGGNREQVPEMLQALLKDRFQVEMHRDKKEFPVYALVVAKGGLKLKESPLDAESSGASGPADAGKAPINVTATGGRGGTSINFGRGSGFSFGDNKFEARKLTMARLAETLARFEDRPVVDMTQVEGTYDFTLQFTPEDYMAMLIRSAVAAGVALPPAALKMLENSSGDSLIAALQTVGLKLETRKAPLEVLVIDRAQKAPTAN